MDSSPNVTIIKTILLNSLSEGSHSIIIFTNNTVGNLGVSTINGLTIDTIAPVITIISPSNSTYNGDIIWLNFTCSESTVWIGYSFDGTKNITINDNVSLGILDDGSHTIIIYTTDSAGKVEYSDVIWFTIDSTSPITIPTSSTTPPATTTESTISSIITEKKTTMTSKSSSYSNIFTILLIIVIIVAYVQRHKHK